MVTRWECEEPCALSINVCTFSLAKCYSNTLENEKDNSTGTVKSSFLLFIQTPCHACFQKAEKHHIDRLHLSRCSLDPVFSQPMLF